MGREFRAMVTKRQSGDETIFDGRDAGLSA